MSSRVADQEIQKRKDEELSTMITQSHEALAAARDALAAEVSLAKQSARAAKGRAAARTPRNGTRIKVG